MRDTVEESVVIRTRSHAKPACARPTVCSVVLAVVAGGAVARIGAAAPRVDSNLDQLELDGAQFSLSAVNKVGSCKQTNHRGLV
jgi:hypothetical protein